MVVHRAAIVEKQQHLYRIVPFGPCLDVEIAMFGGGADGAVEVEFFCRPLAYPSAQAFQGHLDVARAQFDGVVEVLEIALIPDLHRAAVARFMLADTYAFRIVAIGTEGRSAGSADHLRAALMALVLLLEPLAQGFHQLFEPAKGFDQFLFFLAQVLFGKLLQPLFGQFHLLDAVASGDCLDTLEDFGEYPVEAVEMALILHQRGARQIVETFHVIGNKPRIHRLQQRKIFPQGNGNFRFFQLQEEGNEHGITSNRFRIVPQPGIEIVLGEGPSLEMMVDESFRIVLGCSDTDAIQIKENFHCGERDALVSVDETMVHGKAFPQRGGLFDQVGIVARLGA